jgi:hypothetical protein
MHSHQTKRSPLFRSFAGVAVLVWIAAQVLCFVHCNFGGGHGNGKRASCHAPALSQEHHDAPGPTHDDSSPTAACLTLKSALLGGSLALNAPELPVLYTLAPIAFALKIATTEPAASFSRQTWRRDWVFTPEVCLGPAHRNHAPPLS